MAFRAIFRPGNLLWLTAYLAMVASLWAGMHYGRSRALEVYGTPEAQENWEEWVEDARAASEGDGPVRRRVPQAAAPPAYLLMTEHFTSCLVVAIVLSSALFFTMMVMVRGVWNSATRRNRPRPEDEVPARLPGFRAKNSPQRSSPGSVSCVLVSADPPPACHISSPVPDSACPGRVPVRRFPEQPARGRVARSEFA